MIGPLVEFEISNFVAFYFITILAISLGCLIHYGWNSTKWQTLQVRPWEASWIDFALFILMILGLGWFAQGPAQAWVQTFNKPPLFWQQLLPGFIVQGLIFFSLMLCLWRYPRFFGDGINAKDLSAIIIIKKALYTFFFSLIPLFLVAFLWNCVLLLLKYLNINIPLEPQFLVTVLLETQSVLIITLITTFAILIAPITEELIFRAGIYRFLKGHISPRSALIISSLLFAAGHLSISAFLPLFFLGLILTRLYEHTGNIMPSIFFHACFNMNTLILLLGMPKTSL